MKEKPIRVLQIIGSMNQGGAENFLMNIYRKIDTNKIQFDFIVHKDGVFDDEIKKRGGKIYKLKYINEISPFAYKRQLTFFFKEHPEYKIVHSHLNQVSGLILKISKENNIPIRIAHSHNTKAGGNLIVRIYKKWLGLKINKYATIRLACGQDAGKWLYGNEKFIIIRNGIDIKKFAFNIKYRKEIREELKIDDNCVVIGHVGRFDHQKNHEFIIDTMKRLLEKNNNYILILIGIGKLEDKIKEKVKEYNIAEKVKFLNLREDVYKIYSAMDILIFPSLHEGFPLTLIEAQASGVKILCSDRVSLQTNITNYMDFIPLSKGNEYWANYILKTKIKRNNNLDNLYKEKYDDLENAQELEKIYIMSIKKSQTNIQIGESK